MDATRTTLAELAALVADFRDARDWAQFHQPKDLALALGIEAAELGELFLWKTEEAIGLALAEDPFRDRVSEELADVLAFLLYLADATGIDLARALEAKVHRNEARYPADLARGSARKHTELGHPP